MHKYVIINHSRAAKQRAHAGRAAAGPRFARSSRRLRRQKASRARGRGWPGAAGRLLHRYRTALLFLAVLATIWSAVIITENALGSSLENAAAIKMREYMENVVIESVHEVITSDGMQTTGVLSSVPDTEGRITMVTLNTDVVNKISNSIARKVNDDIHDRKTQKMSVSIGTILGSKLLSQVLPDVEFDIRPISVSDVSCETDFDEAGINQTKYRVYIRISTEARVMAPFMAENVHTENTVQIAEAIIVGSVPDTYANIPSDELSDFVS